MILAIGGEPLFDKDPDGGANKSSNVNIGADWEQAVTRMIAKSEAFLALLSDDFLASRNCRFELGKALESKRSLLPVVVTRLDGPLPKELERISFRDMTDSQFGDVADDIARVIWNE
jgi:hypothetical protein